MKDIKSLYLAAKNSRKKNDISAYAEAVHEMFENSPNDYISNLEYIIQSDIGIRTLTEFVDKYGLPISCFDTVMEHLETCIEKCNNAGIDSTLYQEASEYMQAFRQKYIGCFMMEAFFNDECPDDYIKTYYDVNESGLPNRKLAAGLLEKFQEYAIPDIIVTADNIGGNAMDTVLGYIESHSTLGSPATCELVLECVKNLVPESNGVRSMMESKASSGILRSLRERNHQSYREAVITGNDDIMLEYSDDEINAIQDLISINEYKVTWADELNESATDIQNTIYSLYEEFDGLENEDGPLLADESVADSVIPMLPGSAGVVHPMQERPWLVNTRNKKTGDIPGYIKRNHNLGYGEDDSSSDHGSDGDSSSDGTTVDPEPTLDDFKRPSAEDMSTPYSGLDEPKEEPEKLTPAEQKAINNYYYYTYNNSLNKNTSGSFNRDHSTHTSTSTKKTVDDHSKGKRVNSDNINTTPDDEDEFKPVGEDVDVDLPWKLNIFDDSALMTEAVGDADKDRPQSDHPVKDILTDVDRALVKKQQGAKKAVQNVQNAGRAFVKPAVRTTKWVDNMVHNWKDADENSVKEKLADPHARSNLFSAIRTAIVGGSLLKAGLLLNPVFLGLSAVRKFGKNKKEFRIRNEMIGELKTEMEIIDEKIKDADRVGDNKAKYKLMRFKNELNKKLLRVGGPKGWKKII